MLYLPALLLAALMIDVSVPYHERARWHLHFTPTSSSWLNLVEGWFAQLTNWRLRTGTFTSVAYLVNAIDLWAEAWNENDLVVHGVTRCRFVDQSQPIRRKCHRSTRTAAIMITIASG